MTFVLHHPFICSTNSHGGGIEALEIGLPIWEGDEEIEENGTTRTLRRFQIRKYKQGEKTGKRKEQREGLYPSVHGSNLMRVKTMGRGGRVGGVSLRRALWLGRKRYVLVS